MLKLTRFWNLLIIAAAQVFTAGFLMGPERLYDRHLYALALSTVMIAAAGYIINDYYDVKIDYINKPMRVVVGKGVTRRVALFLHGLFSAAGILLGAWLSLRMAALNIFCVFLLWWYSNNLKRWPFVGNFAVALLTGLSVWAVAVLYRSASLGVAAYGVLAFFITLIREIIKDMEDVRGDNTFGCQTLPVVWGMRGTKRFIYFLVAIFGVVVALLDYFLIHLPIAYFVVALYLPLLALVYFLYRADTIRQFRNLSGFCKIIMLLGIGSMALL